MTYREMMKSFLTYEHDDEWDAILLVAFTVTALFFMAGFVTASAIVLFGVKLLGW